MTARSLSLATVLLTMLCAWSPPEWVVLLRSVGPVRFGMTLAEARSATGGRVRSSSEHTCFEATDAQITFFQEGGRIFGADVSDPNVRTRSGIGIGSTVADIRRAYGSSNVRVAQLTYGDGQYATYQPSDHSDRGYSVVFYLGDGRVESFMTGRVSNWADAHDYPCDS